jgi:TP901 family phage tail tape measure protein
MAKITKQIDLQFTAKGLADIQKELNKIIPALPKGKKGKQPGFDIQNMATVLSDQFQKAGGQFDEVSTQQFLKDYMELVRRLDELKTRLVGNLTPELKKQRDQLIENQKIAEDLLQKQKEDIKVSEKAASASGMSKEFSSAVVDESGLTDFKSMRGQKISIYDTIISNRDKLAPILDEINAKFKDSTLEQDKLNLAKDEELKKHNVNLQYSEAELQVEKANTLESLAQVKIAEQINKTKELENKIPDLESKVEESGKNIEVFDEKNLKSGNQQIQGLINSITQLVNVLKTDYKNAISQAIKDDKEHTQTQKQLKPVVEKTASSFGNATKNIINYSLIFNTLKRIYRETIRTIKELDKSLTDMAIVTEMSRKEAWRLVPALQKLGTQTGMTMTEVAALTTEYLKQGKTLKDSLLLTEVAAKAAKIAGISASDSVKYLTSAINGFSLAAEDAMMVSDKFAALAAASATDYEQLAIGMSKFASQAKIAGLSMDFALGMLAKGIETTQEAPESIGTALKTVLARMRELTDYGKTLEDGMDLNRVETSLRQIGIRIRDTNGQFRDMEGVLREVGARWETLNTNQQASVAVSMAGTRQQSRLIAMFNDFGRTLELVEESENSAGATAIQHAEYMEGMQAALTNLTNSWQKFITTITDSDVIIAAVKGITSVIEFISNSLDKMSISGKNAMIAIGLLVLALKAKNIVTKIGLALGILENKQLIKNTILRWKENIAVISGNASLMAQNKTVMSGLRY